jgi:hypothetical protein
MREMKKNVVFFAYLSLLPYYCTRIDQFDLRNNFSFNK